MTDRSQDSVDRRLREMVALSRRHADSPGERDAMTARLRHAHRAALVDLSPEAIEARLQTVASLHRLCLELVNTREPVR